MSNPSQDLISYINSGLAAGSTPDSIRAALKAEGWADADVAAAFGESAPSVKTGKKRLSRWKLALIIVGSLIFLALAAGAGYWFMLKKTGAPPSASLGVVSSAFVGSMRQANDDASVDLTDLEVPAVTVAAENNAYIDSSELEVKYDPNAKTNTIAQLSGKDEWNQAYVDSVVTASADKIKLFMAAAQKPEYQAPNLLDPQTLGPTTKIVSYGAIRELTRVMALDAISKAKNGNSADGADEALAIVVYGQKVALAKNPLIGYLVGMSIKKIGLDALSQIASLGQLPADRAQKIDQALAALTDTGSGLADGLRTEFWNFKNSIDYTLKHPESDSSEEKQMSKVSYLFEPNKTVNIAGKQYRELVKLATSACRKFDPPAVPEQPFDQAEKFEVENSVGITLSKIPVDSLTRTLNQRCDDVAQVAAVRASLASAAASGNVTPAPVAPEPPAADGLPAITVTHQFGGFSFTYTDIISNKYLHLFQGKDEVWVGELPSLLPCEEKSAGGTTQTAASISGREYCVKIEKGAVKAANQSTEYKYTTAFTGGPPAIQAAVKAVEIEFGTNGFNCEAAFADDATRLAECVNANSVQVMNKFADQIFKSITFFKK